MQRKLSMRKETIGDSRKMGKTLGHYSKNKVHRVSSFIQTEHSELSESSA